MLCNQYNNSTQTSYGENSTAETVRSAKHHDGGSGDGDGGGGGVEGEVRGQRGVLGSAVTALWGKFRPFVDGEYTDGTGESLISFIFFLKYILGWSRVDGLLVIIN